ncbi:MAG: hypothetical protein Q9191_000450 [Dirinaria sp. TL-2023a]
MSTPAPSSPGVAPAKRDSGSAVAAQWNMLPLCLEEMSKARKQLSLNSHWTIDLRAAVEVFWAILLRAYTGSDHVVFGCFDEAVGKSNRVTFDFGADALRSSVTRLPDIRKTTTSDLHDLSTVIWLTQSLDWKHPKKQPFYGQSNTVTLQLHYDPTNTFFDEGTFWYQQPSVSPDHGDNLLSTLHQLARSILDNPTSRLDKLDLFSIDVEDKFDFLDAGTATNQLSSPSFCRRPAVRAWDSRWTYRQLREKIGLFTRISL